MLLEAAIASLIATCSPPGTAPETIEAVVRVESGGRPFALGVNRPNADPISLKPATREEAAYLIDSALARGYSVDIGLMQVNTTTARKRGLDWRTLLDPCENIRVGAAILNENYLDALRTHPPGQTALQAALSAYNTGNKWAGFANGYVARYYGGAVTPEGFARPSGTNPFTADSQIYSNKDFADGRAPD